MKRFNWLKLILICSLIISLSLCIDCAKKDTGKIPVTTNSREAKNAFLKGRQLTENLQIEESRAYFEKAVKLDPEFAQGYLYLSFAQPTFKDYFEYFNLAKQNMTDASDGEQWYILGTEAGVNGLPMIQRDYYQKMVQEYPRDERAHSLLGVNYFGQQEYENAVSELDKAISINPKFPSPYNMKGYAHRFLGQYEQAEEAFKKYIELIPNDPNPYDSYAELLMKIGKYDESIENYEKALEQNPNFVASYIGIATNLNFKGEHIKAREKLQELYEITRNTGEKRQALFAMAVSCADEGDLAMALQMIEKTLAMDTEIDDPAAMSADLVNMGNLYLEMGSFNDAKLVFGASLKTVTESDLDEDFKANSQRQYLFNSCRLSIKQKDFETAGKLADEFMQEVTEINNPFQIKQAHQLKGMIACQQDDFETAITELNQSNLQNPQNLFRLAKAYKGMGEMEKAKDYCLKAANFNLLNSMQYAFVRTKAAAMASEM